MAYVASNYDSNPKAPLGEWVCTPDTVGAMKTAPNEEQGGAPNLCGQCVSYVKQVCNDLPNTKEWRRGTLVKGQTTLAKGTVIATFNAKAKYSGHAAIYVSQDETGIQVFDQYRTQPNPKPVGPRTLSWTGSGVNDGNKYHVVE